MKTSNDRKLAKCGKGHIDLILGGHIHHSVFEDATDETVCLIKSGSDFQEFSDIRYNFISRKIEWRNPILMDVDNKKFTPDPDILKLVEKYQEA